MKKKIVVSDIDGTLLNTSKQIPEKTIETVNELRKQNIEFTIGTGRIYPVVLDIVEQMKITSPLVLCNGAVVQDPVSGEIYFSKFLNNDTAVKILDMVDKTGMYYYYYTSDSINAKELKYTTAYYNDNNSKTKQDVKIKINLTQDILEKAKNDEVLKVVVLDEDVQKLTDFRKKLENFDDIEIVSSYWNNIEIVARGISKGEGVKFLVEKFGYDMENVMCIGDEENDESMLKVAGFAVAMGNANKKMKEIADFVTDDNDHDGMSKALIEFSKR